MLGLSPPLFMAQAVGQAAAAHRRTVSVAGTTFTTGQFGTFGTDYFPGDWVIITATRHTDPTAITIGTPTGGTFITTDAFGNSIGRAHAVASLTVAVAAIRVGSTAISIGTWTSAQHIVASFYSGLDPVTPIWEWAYTEESAGAAAASIETPALGFATPGSSVIYGILKLDNGASTPTFDARMDVLANRGGAVNATVVGQTAAQVTAWAAGSGSQTATGTNSYIAMALRLKPESVSFAPTIAAVGTISGAAVVGSVLSVSGFSYSGSGAPSYQWTRGGADIPGAVNPNYLLKPADAGASIARRVTFANGGSPVTGATPGVTVAVAEAAATFDPVYIGAGVTLSNGNKSARTADNMVARTSKAFYPDSPKFYAEVVVPAGASAFSHIGVTHYGAQAYSPPTGATAVNADYTIALLNQRVIDRSAFGLTRGLTLNAGAGGVYRIAVDPAAGLVYFGTSAGWTNGSGTAVAFGSAQGFPMPIAEEWFISLAARSTAGDLVFTLRSLYSEFTNYSTDTALIAAGFVSFGEINAYSAAAPVRASDELLEMVGVNYDIGDLPVALRPTGHDRIGELGIRTIRTTMGGQMATDTAYDWFVNPTYGLNSRFGTKLIALGATKSNTPAYPSYPNIPQTINVLQNVGASRLRAIEGPNEANYLADPGWDVRSVDAQADIYARVNASGSSIAGVPVLGFTSWERSKKAEADVRALLGGGNFIAGGGGYGQMANAIAWHNYNPQRRVKNCSVGQDDGEGFDFVRMETGIATVRLQGGGGSVPVWATELGAKGAQFQYPPDGNNLNMAAMAKMMPRAVMTHLSAGCAMAVMYCLYDSQNLFAANNSREFGLCAFDGDWPGTPPKVKGFNKSGNPIRNVDGGYEDLKRRPVFYAIKSLLSIFNESGSLPADLTGLSYGLSGDLSDICHLFFKRTDGKFLLAIWQDAQTWNETTAVINPIAERPVKLGLTRSASSIRRRTLATTSTETTWTSVATDAQELTLSVPDEVVVYEIAVA